MILGSEKRSTAQLLTNQLFAVVASGEFLQLVYLKAATSLASSS